MSLLKHRVSKALGTLQFKRAIQLVWQASHRWTIASALLVLIQGILPLLSLFLLKLMVEAVIAGAAAPDKTAVWGHIFQVVLLAGFVALLSAVCDAVSTYVNQGQGLAVTDYMTSILHAKAIEVDMEFYENPDFHNKLHRAQQEAPTRPTRIVRGLTSLAQSLITLLAIAGLLISLHWAIVLVLMITAFPGVLVRLKFIEATYAWQRTRTLSERIATYFNWALTHGYFAKEVRLFDTGPVFIQRSLDLRRVLNVERMDLARRRALADIVVQCFAVIPMFGCFAFIAYWSVNAGKPAEFVMYLTALQRGQGALQGVLNGILNLREDNTFLTNIYEFLDLAPTVVPPAKPVPMPQAMQQGIVLEDISFAYPRSERQALKGVSMHIRPGEVVALVGQNGSGKSTLVKLLCRLYDPSSGAIKLDGTDLRDFDPMDYRRHISVVFQDYVQYEMTVRENIWLGNSSLDINDERIISAARDAGLDEVVQTLPNGYDTKLGHMLEAGEELSIGQWQKIALARAFLRDSQLIILDEPTSALDPEAEYEVFEKFRQLVKGQSAVLISHRLSTVRMANRICVMEDGRIVEDGSHDELMRHNGIYARLFETQAKSYA